MFKIGDYIVYGNSGVCVVENIGILDSPAVAKDKVYYTLSPYYVKGSRIQTPVDNDKVVMRPIISKEEAMDLIDNMKDIELLWIEDEKRREIEYKNALRKCDCVELVKVIKTIHVLKQSRIAEGKKLTLGDEKYFHMAEDRLYEEMAVSLGMCKDKVKDFITERI